MEYSDLATFERLTGLALFTPQGQSGAINLGSIEMLKVDYGVKSIDKKVSVRGRLSIGQRKYTEAAPVYSIDGNQLVTPNIPLLLLGDQLDDFVQAAASGSTFTFTATAGMGYLVGAYNISNAVVKVGSTTMTENTDYFVDYWNGIVSLPVNPAGITDGSTVVVTFDQPLLWMEQYQAFTKLNRPGQLVVFAEDGDGPPAKEIWTMSVSLSCKKGSDIDPTKFRKFTLEAAIFGSPIVLRRSNTTVALVHLGTGGDTFNWQ